MADYSILPGTNRDVWIFPSLKTIATHYPDVSLVHDTATFFFDYENASDVEREEILQKVREGRLEVRQGRELFSGNHFFVDKVASTHKFSLIAVSWIKYLQRTKKRPPLSVLGDFYLNFARSFPVQDPARGRVYTIVATFGGNKSNPHYAWMYEAASALDVQGFLNIAHPLAHFPPDCTDQLASNETPLFFDRRIWGEELSKLISWYGDSVGRQIADAAYKTGRNIRYSEIVRPYGEYGLTVDFSSVGLGIRYDVPMNHIIDAYSKQGMERNSYYHHSATDDRGKKWDWYYVDEINFSPYPKIATLNFDRRDSWIQCWMRGGKIPIDPQEISVIKNGQVVEFKFCPHTDFLYPIVFRAPERDKLGELGSALFSVAVVVTAGYMAITTGNMGSIMKEVATVVARELKNQFPEISEYVDLSLPLVVCPLIDRHLPQSEEAKKDKAQKFLMSMVDPALTATTGIGYDTEKNIADTVDMIDQQLTTKEKSIISAISSKVSPRYEPVAGQIRELDRVTGLTLVPGQLHMKPSTPGWMLGAGIVGGALVLKKLLKK